MRLDEAGLTQWGARIGQTIETPVFIGLSGELGAGKSVLARAIGTGAGVRAHMPSPSYTLVHRYRARGEGHLVHLDLYRLASADELWELGWKELGRADEIVLVEWPERAGASMPPDHWAIGLSTPAGEPRLRDVEVAKVGSPPALAPFPLSLSRR